MENDIQDSSTSSKFIEKLNEQVWFQELKQKWEEIDPKVRVKAQVGALLSFCVALTLVVGISYWKVLGIKREYQSKAELLSMIQSGNDELRQLSSTRRMGGESSVDLNNADAFKTYLKGISVSANLGEDALDVKDVKPGKSSDLFEESLSTIELKNVNIKQLTQVAYEIEHGALPIRLRKLEIDTKSDQTGYISASLFVSAYKIK